jgi:hypothetical protein
MIFNRSITGTHEKCNIFCSYAIRILFPQTHSLGYQHANFLQIKEACYNPANFGLVQPLKGKLHDLKEVKRGPDR